MNPAKPLVSRRTKNHSKGIEGFGSYAKQIWYQERGVSHYHFPLSLRAVESRLTHRPENVLKQFLKSYFCYGSP